MEKRTSSTPPRASAAPPTHTAQRVPSRSSRLAEATAGPAGCTGNSGRTGCTGATGCMGAFGRSDGAAGASAAAVASAAGSRSSAPGCPDAGAEGASRAEEPAMAICARSELTSSANPARVVCSAAIRRRWRNASTTAIAARTNANPSIRPGPAPPGGNPAAGDPPIPHGAIAGRPQTHYPNTHSPRTNTRSPRTVAVLHPRGCPHALRKELCGLPPAPGLFCGGTGGVCRRRAWKSLTPSAGGT